MKNILILEDYEAHRNILMKILQEIEGIRIYVATNKEEAYQIAIEKNIHLFLVDIILNTEIRGDVSGLNFVEAIRKIPKYVFVPLIFITSLEDPQLYAYKNLHCFGYIEKPFEPEYVKNLIKQALKFPDLKEEYKEEKTVYFRVDGVIYAVKSNDIIYMENSKRQLKIFTAKETMIIPYKTCNQIMEEVGYENFIQCSRFTIVNKRYIQRIDYVNRYIKLKGVEKQIDIGITMKTRVRDAFGN